MCGSSPRCPTMTDSPPRPSFLCRRAHQHRSRPRGCRWSAALRPASAPAGPTCGLVVTWAGDLGKCDPGVSSGDVLPGAAPASIAGRVHRASLFTLRSLSLGDIDGGQPGRFLRSQSAVGGEPPQLLPPPDRPAVQRLPRQHTRKDDGTNALSLELSPPPKLTARQFIDEQIVDFATLALHQQLLTDPRFPDKTFMPVSVRDLVCPASPEVQRCPGSSSLSSRRGWSGELGIP